MFGIRRKNEEPDEAQSFLESVMDEPEQPDPCEQDDLELSDISAKDSRIHCDIVNIIVLAFVMLFFGTGFLTLTNYQNFADNEPFSFQALVSGRFFSHVEKSFNESLPLRDFLHNANEFVGYCFGLGNTPDYLDLTGSRDDTLSIVDENGFVPIDDYRADGSDDPDNMETSPIRDDGDIFSRIEDDGKNKPITGIVMATSASTTRGTSNASSTTTNNREPGATTTTTVPPESSATTTEPTTTTAATSDEEPSVPDTTVPEPDVPPEEPPEEPEEPGI